MNGSQYPGWTVNEIPSTPWTVTAALYKPSLPAIELGCGQGSYRRRNRGGWDPGGGGADTSRPVPFKHCRPRGDRTGAGAARSWLLLVAPNRNTGGCRSAPRRRLQQVRVEREGCRGWRRIRGGVENWVPQRRRPRHGRGQPRERKPRQGRLVQIGYPS